MANEYDDLIKDERTDALRSSMYAGSQQNPQTEAKLQRLSDRTGVPLDAVRLQQPEVELQEKLNNFDYDKVIKENPVLSDWLSDPKNSALAHDDWENLSGMEKLFTRAKDYTGALAGGVVGDAIGRTFSGASELLDVGARSLDRAFRMVAPKSVADALWYEPATLGGVPLDPLASLKSSGKSLKALGDWMKPPTERQNLGTDVAGGIGQIGGQIATFLLTGGAATVGTMFAQGADVMADKTAKDIADPALKDTAILAGGAITAITEKYGLDKIINRVPPEIKNRTMRFLADKLAAGGIEAAQEFTEGLLHDLARKTLTNADAEVLEGVGREMSAAGLSAMIVRTALGVRGHARAQEQEQFIKAITDQAADSKLRQNMPERFQQYMEKVTAGGPVENVFIPAEQFKEYFQSVDVDPAVIASKLGVQNYAEAVVGGGDVVVPTAAFVTQLSGTDHLQGLWNDLRFNQADMTLRESQLAEANRDQTPIDDETLRRIVGADADVGARPGFNEVRDSFIGELTGRFPLDQAEARATGYASAITTMAERMGVSPMELHQRFDLTVNSPLPDGLKTLADRVDVDIDPLLDRIRSGDLPQDALAFGASLVEFVRDAGGLRDSGEARDLDQSVTRKPGQRKLVQPNGMSADAALQAAAEAGYFPGVDVSELTEADFLNALADDLGGNHRYSALNENNAAANDLRMLREMADWLDSIGADVQSMTNKQVRDVISRASKAAIGDVYEQNINQGARGSINVMPDGRMQINLFEKADASTLFHELGHFYLEVLGELSTDPNAPRQMRDDFQTIRNWMGLKDGEGIKVEHHEMFARAHEAYIMEGNTPSPEMRGIFVRFSSWMKQVYRSLVELRVPMSDEVRGVFDRIYATDDQIEAAKDEGLYTAALTTAEMVGMTEAEHAAYLRSVESAVENGRDRLRVKLMKEMKREQETQWKANRKAMKDAVSAEVDEQPVYVALQALSAGETADGLAVKLDKSELQRLYGKEFLKKLPKSGGKAIYNTKDDSSIDLDTAAEVLGFDSGRTMIDQLVNMQPRASLIEKITDERMVEQYGDTRFDGSIGEAAERALHNSSREDMLKIELRAIRKKASEVGGIVRAKTKEAAAFANRERDYERRWMEAEKNLAIDIERGIAAEKIQQIKDAIAAEKQAIRDEKAALAAGEQMVRESLPQVERTGRTKEGREFTFMAFDPEPMKRAAAGLIGQKQYRDVQPQSYLLAERKAAKATAKAMKDGDYILAAEQKQRELFNHYLYKESTRAKEKADKQVEYINSRNNKRVRSLLGRAGADYLEQQDEIMERYEFKTVPLNKLDRRQSLQAFVNQQEAEGKAVSIPEEVLNEARRVNWKQVPLDELGAVYDSIKNINHLANWKDSLIVKGKRREFKEMKAELLASIEESGLRSTGDIEAQNKHERTMAQKGAAAWRTYDAAHMKVEQLVEWLDGGDISGPWARNFFDLADEAQTKEYDLHRMVTMAINDLRNEMPKGWKDSLWDQVGFDLPVISANGVKATKPTRYTMLSIALNMGNEQNMQRLRDGNQISDVQMQQIRESMTDADWKFVQGVWDSIEQLWPDMAALEKRSSGLEPVKVDAQSFTVRGQSYRGGYFPLVYDRRASRIGERQVESSQSVDQFLAAGVGRPTTNKGATKERSESVGAPLLLDMNDVLSGHIAKVVKDVSHREAIAGIHKILSDQDIKSALIDRLGDAYYQQLRNWSQVLVNDRSDSMNAAVGAARWMMTARTNLAIVTMGLKFSTALSQFAGFGPSADLVSPKYLAKALVQVANSPIQSWAFIAEKSGEMRNRVQTIDRDVRDSLRRIADKDTLVSDVQRTAFIMTAYADRIVTMPTWMGAYNQAMGEGRAEEDAVRAGDRAVRLSQGGGGAKDLAAIQRNNELMKLLTMFYTPFSALYARLRDIGHQTAVQGIGYLPEAVARTVGLVILPALLGQMLAGRGPDEDEDKVWWSIRQMMLYPISALPVIRDFSGLVEQQVIKASGEGSMDYMPSYNLSPITSAIAKAWKNLVANPLAVAQGDKSMDGDVAWGVFESAGLIVGLPTAQARITGSYLVDLMTGDADPENALELVRDMIYKRKKE